MTTCFAVVAVNCKVLYLQNTLNTKVLSAQKQHTQQLFICYLLSLGKALQLSHSLPAKVQHGFPPAWHMGTYCFLRNIHNLQSSPRFVHPDMGLGLGSGQYVKCSHSPNLRGKIHRESSPCSQQRQSTAVCNHPTVSALVILIFLMTPRISGTQASVQKNLAAPDRAEHTSKSSRSGSAPTRYINSE